MSSERRKLKRQILEQAVAENVESRGGRARSGGSNARAWVLALVAVLSAGTAVFFLFEPPPPAPPSSRQPAAPAPAPPEPGPLHLVLDPSHGGEDPGIVVETQVEKEVTLDLASRLSRRLEESGFEISLTRDGDRALSLRQRAEIANTRGADAFVSIHLSRIDAEETQGIETYYLGATDDPTLAELARQENRGSGYSLGDLRRLLEGIYAHPQRQASRRLAESVQRSLYRSLLPVDPTLRDLGASPAPFVVLVATEMPAVVAEVSCLTTRGNLEILSRPRYRDHIAEALARGIQSYFQDTDPGEDDHD